ncbi:hypothetical protein B1992_05505 [Pseudoxanthomonas broegbernensis]|uniref:Lipoprotein n=1 Tax=Pseudoxanthomonas broegbernensis TaxID=83619 RepID=A0A7V8GN21_9GAMM|nr:hypothetical protein [Pseudoxanthomonas broegbernensis]KAF1686850.1 hypothetical protein B1992_05505 [Pseudoxanthomonas broegbernensis]MBB6065562.1 hypothetical protein [Pseudoxanthomonas broegbernensis]
MYRIAVSCVLLCLAACSAPAPDELAERAAGKAAAAAVAAASEGQVKLEAGQERLVVEDGGQTMEVGLARGGLPRPDWWPQDVYLPEDAAIHQVARNEGSHVLAAAVARPGAALHGEIERAMHGLGWSTVRNSLAASGSGMAAYRKDGREVTVLVAASGKAGQPAMATFHLRGAAAR